MIKQNIIRLVLLVFASNIFLLPGVVLGSCGDNICGSNENCFSCPNDCNCVNPQFFQGEYFGLPNYYPEKSPHGGIFEIWQPAVRWRDNTDMLYITHSWRALNPSENSYSFEKFDTGGSWNYGLKELRENGKKALLYLPVSYHTSTSSYEGFHVPEWVQNKCKAEGKPISVIIPFGNAPSFLAIWEECPKRELVKFIRQLVRFKNEPALAYAYMTTFIWGEFNMRREQLDNAVAKGLTGAILQNFCKEFTDAWVYALGSEKLVWEGHSVWGSSYSEINAASGWCNDYAFNVKGTNIREGMGHIGKFIKQPMLKQSFDENRYLYAETIHNLGKSGISFYGTEFTEGDLGIFNDYKFFRMSILNMIRAGINWPTFGAGNPKLLDHENDSIYPEFMALRDYTRQIVGYPVKTSPDAFAILLQWSDYACYKLSNIFRPQNYEKFLIQREIEINGRTNLVERNDWPMEKRGFCSTRESYAYLARKTMRASGQDYIYFNLHDDFLTPPENSVQFSVYYKDDNTAKWNIEYNSLSSDYEKTPFVQNIKDGKWKTALFTVKNAGFRNSQVEKMDFRIYNGGKEDITISSVRVIRLKTKIPILGAPDKLIIK